VAAAVLVWRPVDNLKGGPDNSLSGRSRPTGRRPQESGVNGESANQLPQGRVIRVDPPASAALRPFRLGAGPEPPPLGFIPNFNAPQAH